MLTALISMILYPLILKKDSSRWSHVRGLILGITAAAVIGLFLPTMQNRVSALNPLRVEKSFNGTSDQFTALAMNTASQIQTYTIPVDKAVITVLPNATGDVQFYECHKTFAESWMHYVGLCYPTKSYEIAIPRSMADTILNPAPADKLTVIYQKNATDGAAVAAQ